METVSPVAQDDSSGANPNSVKSEDSSPRHESGRGSPPPNCAICLGTCKNKSFTDSCLHQFCFTCLLTWSKVKAECPLCKQNFKSIIHNVRSNHQYEEYMVEQRETEETIERFDIDSTIAQATRRFRYRTTLTLPRRDSLAIQQLLLQYPAPGPLYPPRATTRRQRSPASFRRTVYRHNLYARPLPDFTGRFRDCSPEFYRYNDTQMHRLVPWLNRELHYLLNENVGHISYVITRILELLPQYHINSPEFRAAVQPYFRDRTEHFLHELYCFASTPYDMTGYDRNVQYTTDTRISTMINEVISSSESDASVDSDIVMVSSSEPAEPPPGPSRIAGPSRVPQPVYPQNYIAEPSNNVIPIETISHSDTDDDSSEVMVVGYIKPPQDRTPEVVDLLGSDSDVIVQDNTPPPQPAPSTEQESASAPLVKLILKHHMPNEDSSDNDSTYRPRPRSRRRTRSSDTATTSDTWRSTPEPPTEREPGMEPWLPNASSASTSTSIPTSTSTSTSMSDITFSDFSSSSSVSSDRRSRPVKKKTKRKSRKESSSKEKKKVKKRTSRPRKDRSAPDKDRPAPDKDKRNKRKTNSGKGVKSSKKNASPEPSSTERTPTTEEQPGTSGTSNSHKRRESKDRKRRRSSRSSRENKRLKSVVNVINKKTLEEPSSSATSLSSAVINPNSTSAGPTSTPPTEIELPEMQSSSVAVEARDYTDSEGDELPLNLTVQKTFHSL